MDQHIHGVPVYLICLFGQNTSAKIPLAGSFCQLATTQCIDLGCKTIADYILINPWAAEIAHSVKLSNYQLMISYYRLHNTTCLMIYHLQVTIGKPCNKWLCNKKIKSESRCTFCNDVDDLIHFLIYCENTMRFWTSFYKWWNNISEFNMGRNYIFEEFTLFGYPGEEDIIQILNYCVACKIFYIH